MNLPIKKALLGGMKAVMAALMGHLLYGGLLGAIAGRADNCCSAHAH